MDKLKKRIAILGGGPSALFMYKRFVEARRDDIEISIFERKQQLGSGMPYSAEGANYEHITNVSDNEIPTIVCHITDWVKTLPIDYLAQFNIDPENFNEYRVLPRLFFGKYLSAQFDLLKQMADKQGLKTNIYLGVEVIDIVDLPEEQKVKVKLANDDTFTFDQVIVCTGHNWPKKYEGKTDGYFDSPYPPSKISLQINHPVAIKGSSLTAIDAIRTLSRKNGRFEWDKNDELVYVLNKKSEGFKLIMHSKNGMLPAVRFHLEDPRLSGKSLLSKEEIQAHREDNNGFISLDYIFEKDFKEIIKTKDPEFYSQIAEMKLEVFVDFLMDLRERLDPFQLLRAEYLEAEKSIKRKQSVYWKELLAMLSFAMNYPAKYLAAEDMLRLQKILMPLISIVIAFVPQTSCRELLALHKAGVLDLIAVGVDSEIEVKENGGIIYHYQAENGKSESVYYQTFIDCVGQPHLNYHQFPFKSLVAEGTISPAKLKFKSKQEGEAANFDNEEAVELTETGDYYLKVPGIAINDNFNVVDEYGAFNDRIFMMAVPYIGGFNPDYSGLDFSEEASARIIKSV
ncbi:FAD/NAD(P)-binding protein [Pedobacter frigiditerrae]|uniref:FAD/NAD(P)-binding protein n=1 Tax=Pedobacter frigiditerrae TaxID=2530452 RepID=UPI00292ED350|nr:FAD/NAD(P)-binding protein [Pedobacter frigiditerrae]